MGVIHTFFVLLFSALVAQSAPSTCDVPQRHQFDFAVGDWTVVDSTGQPAGTNHITREMRGCVIQEHWLGSDGELGTSFYSYMPYIDRWQSTWVDSEGRTVLLQGDLRGNSLVVEGDRVNRAGAMVADRITWTPLPDGRVRQHLQETVDAGLHWNEIFDGYYTKRR